MARGAARYRSKKMVLRRRAGRSGMPGRPVAAPARAAPVRPGTEQQYRAMFENAAVGITRVDLNGVLVDLNQKFCDMLGYSRGELLGKAVSEITHPDDYGQGSRYRAEVAHGAQSRSGEKRFLRK